MFFTAIHQMMTEGVDLTLVIRKANGQMAVSTLPKSNTSPAIYVFTMLSAVFIGLSRTEEMREEKEIK